MQQQLAIEAVSDHRRWLVGPLNSACNRRRLVTGSWSDVCVSCGPLEDWASEKRAQPASRTLVTGVWGTGQALMSSFQMHKHTKHKLASNFHACNCCIGRMEVFIGTQRCPPGNRVLRCAEEWESDGETIAWCSGLFLECEAILQSKALHCPNQYFTSLLHFSGLFQAHLLSFFSASQAAA